MVTKRSNYEDPLLVAVAPTVVVVVVDARFDVALEVAVLLRVDYYSLFE